ncbi:hypothetical protein ACA910_012185 [Epithemia clementina (nom. ined.)]
MFHNSASNRHMIADVYLEVILYNGAVSVSLLGTPQYNEMANFCQTKGKGAHGLASLAQVWYHLSLLLLLVGQSAAQLLIIKPQAGRQSHVPKYANMGVAIHHTKVSSVSGYQVDERSDGKTPDPVELRSSCHQGII